MQKKEQAFLTKQRLAGALKEALKTKPLDKIRIHELTDRCGLYRQTFYYHFTDLESLLFWAAQQDTEMICSHQAGLSCQERIEQLLRYTLEYRGFFLAVISEKSYPAQRQALFTQASALLSVSMQQEQKEPLLPAPSYTMVLSSVLEQWVRGTPQRPLEEVARLLTELFGETYQPPAPAI